MEDLFSNLLLGLFLLALLAWQRVAERVGRVVMRYVLRIRPIPDYILPDLFFGGITIGMAVGAYHLPWARSAGEAFELVFVGGLFGAILGPGLAALRWGLGIHTGKGDPSENANMYDD
jgi:hypothetical protein